MNKLLTILLAVLCSTSMVAQLEIGQWRDHLPYQKTIDVAVSSDVIYAGTPFAVFAYRKEDNSISRISKTNLLSDASVSAIGVSDNGNTLVIGHSNGNLDVIEKGVGYNLPDIKQSDLFGNKSINDIHFLNDRAYLSCGFGIVEVNLTRKEIANTWFINGQDDLLFVNTLESSETHWYAATTTGIYTAEINNPFLANFESWTKMSDVPFETANYIDLMLFDGRLFLIQENGSEDSVWYADLEDMNWNVLENYESRAIYSIAKSPTHFTITSYGAAERFDASLASVQLQQSIAGSFLQPYDVQFDAAGDMWLANETGGLLFMGQNDEEEAFAPAGPPHFNARQIDAYNDAIWVASGGVDPTWTSNYDKKGVYGLVNDKWVIVPENQGLNDISLINDYMAVSINPVNNNEIFLGSWEEGLVQVKNGVVETIYNEENSPLEQANFGGSLRIGVGGADHDQNGNLWYTNTFSDHPLQLRTANGEFVAFDFLPEIGTSELIGDVLAARQGFVWMIRPRGDGLILYNPGENLTDSSDDDYRLLTNEPGEGGLPNSDVYCLEEDLDGEIWVGTLQGIAVFYAPQNIFSSENFDAQQILIEQDGNVQILLETETINCIEIDGANRKWVGTQNSGVYLFSEDGLDQIFHFTSENSPLLSNNVLDIAVNHSKGEVFFATEKGLISFMGTATNFDPEIEDVVVYPNPVRPDFTGVITIDGLAYETDVKITDIAGQVVHSATSNGGRVIWDGNDFNGARVSTGVYLVYCSTSDGGSVNVARIAMVR